MILLGSPFFPQFILFYFTKWQFFLEKPSCTLKNTSFSISSKLFTKYQKSVVKKFMGTYKLLASRLLLTCCYNKIWVFLLQCVPPYYNDVKLLQTPHIYIFQIGNEKPHLSHTLSWAKFYYHKKNHIPHCNVYSLKQNIIQMYQLQVPLGKVQVRV